MNIVLLGPPGSGKGTQAKLIHKKFSLNHLSTGDLLRKEVSMESKIGLQINKIINKGELVSNEIIIQLIKSFINNDKSEDNKLLFDGFPRNKSQAELLDDLFIELKKELACVIFLDVKESILKKRILSRGSDEGRTDDNLETLSKRLEVYFAETKPLVEYYSSRNLLKSVQGIGEINEVNQRINVILETF